MLQAISALRVHGEPGLKPTFSREGFGHALHFALTPAEGVGERLNRPPGAFVPAFSVEEVAIENDLLIAQDPINGVRELCEAVLGLHKERAKGREGSETLGNSPKVVETGSLNRLQSAIEKPFLTEIG